MPLISIKNLYPDPRNANHCDETVMAKLQRSIAQSGFYQSLTVRPHPTVPYGYILVDGHHRLKVLEALGHTEVECQVQEMSEEAAGLLLLTLNRLRGEDQPRKRAELMESLLPVWDISTLAELLPESPAEIEGLLALLKAEDEALEQKFNALMAEEKKSLPVPLGFMIPADEVGIVQDALAKYQAPQQRDQGQALVAMCRDILAFASEEAHRGGR